MFTPMQEIKTYRYFPNVIQRNRFIQTQKNALQPTSPITHLGLGLLFGTTSTFRLSSFRNSGVITLSVAAGPASGAFPVSLRGEVAPTEDVGVRTWPEAVELTDEDA